MKTPTKTHAMKTGLGHLPEAKRADLTKAVELIVAAGEPEMIILFGSHARGDWVEDIQQEGKNLFEYQSDFDLYVLTRLAKHVNRYTLNPALRRRFSEIIRTPVSLIADTVKHFNESLERGRYFYVDVAKEGIILYDSGRIAIVEPRELSREERLEEVTSDYEYWFNCADSFFNFFDDGMRRGDFRGASFQLHQAVEHYTTTALLVLTSYKPKGHDIEERLKQCAALDARFGQVFPVVDAEDLRRFELLCAAYIGARYKKDFRISREDLEHLVGHVRELRDLTQSTSDARIWQLSSSET